MSTKLTSFILQLIKPYLLLLILNFHIKFPSGSTNPVCAQAASPYRSYQIFRLLLTPYAKS